MKGYSGTEVFTEKEIAIWRWVLAIVEAMDEVLDLRCHELARAVAISTCNTVALRIVDGKFGAVDHSWLSFDIGIRPHRKTILDVYAVGRLPIVQLVHVTPLLPNPYVEGPAREDIDRPMLAKAHESFVAAAIKRVPFSLHNAIQYASAELSR